MGDETTGLVIEREGSIVRMRINRPEAGNTIDVDTRDGMIRTLEESDADPTVRAIVITGTGKTFCTGADLAGGTKRYEAQTAPGRIRTPLELRSAIGSFQKLAFTLWHVETPVVSAINGTVAGAGLTVALAADIVVSAEGVQFRSLFAEGGMMPHAGDPYVLPRVFPFRRLMEFAMLRERYTAEDMLAWNVINFIVPAEKLEARTQEIAERLATGPTLSLGQAKRLYRRSLETDAASMFQNEALTLGAISMTRDRQEGIRALIERRRAEFTGE